jgi:DNA-binding NarL/FixJ family response regulator
MIRVLLADDEPVVTDSLRVVLESTSDIRVVATVAGGRAAVEAALRGAIDVALLDIVMPGLDGLGALEELRRLKLPTRVVLLTSFGAEPQVRRAVEHGASGYLLKNCTPEDLIRAVRAAHAGEAFLSPAVTRTVLGLVPPAPPRREAAARLAPLSPRELDVLRLVAEGLSNAEVGRRAHLSELTVKTYMSRILTKTGCTNRVQAALLVHHAEPGR